MIKYNSHLLVSILITNSLNGMPDEQRTPQQPEPEQAAIATLNHIRDLTTFPADLDSLRQARNFAHQFYRNTPAINEERENLLGELSDKLQQEKTNKKILAPILLFLGIANMAMVPVFAKYNPSPIEAWLYGSINCLSGIMGIGCNYLNNTATTKRIKYLEELVLIFSNNERLAVQTTPLVLHPIRTSPTLMKQEQSQQPHRPLCVT